MKKILLTVILLGTFLVGLTGCGKIENKFDIGEKSDIVEVNPNNGISLSIKEGTLTNTGATIIITNNIPAKTYKIFFFKIKHSSHYSIFRQVFL